MFDIGPKVFKIHMLLHLFVPSLRRKVGLPPDFCNDTIQCQLKLAEQCHNQILVIAIKQ